MSDALAATHFDAETSHRLATGQTHPRPPAPLPACYLQQSPRREDVDEVDFQLLLNSDLGVVIVEDNKLAAAQQMITELKGEMV